MLVWNQLKGLVTALETQLDRLEEFADEEMQEIPKVQNMSPSALFLSIMYHVKLCTTAYIGQQTQLWVRFTANCSPVAKYV